MNNSDDDLRQEVALYHNTTHRGLEGRTPLEQWALASAGVRYPEPTLNLDEIFLFEVRRRVQKDRTVSLDGRLYEVEPLLVGRSVTLRYDPDAPPHAPSTSSVRASLPGRQLVSMPTRIPQ